MISKFVAVLPLILALLSGRPFFARESQEKHVIVLDAGSTGSRVYVYKYDHEHPLETIQEVAHMRVNPALSTFVNNSAGLSLQLSSLIEFAMTMTPPLSWASIDISLKATAGLRSLNVDDQKYLIDATVDVFRKSVFSCDPINTKVISGEEEALFDVLAVTALFQSYKDGFVSLGAADMGGSSQQIAFLYNATKAHSESEQQLRETADPEMPVEVEVDPSRISLITGPRAVTGPGSGAVSVGCSSDWRISIPGRNERVEIYAKSMEYMGLIGAMDTVLENFYADQSVSNCTGRSDVTMAAGLGLGLNAVNSIGDDNIGIAKQSECSQPLHPCLPDGSFPEVPGFLTYPQPLHGLGDFDKCLDLLRAVLVPKAQLTVDLSCVKANRPKVMVGMDNYPKVLEILGIPQGVTIAPSEIRRRAILVCRRPWRELLADFPTFMPYRAQRACFGATYVYSMLVDVYGIEDDDKEAFLPVDSVGEYELSWALGAALFSAMDLKV